MTKRRIYLASPLFNPVERKFNSDLAETLSIRFEVFLPQRDGMLLANLLRQGYDKDIARSMIYNADIRAIEGCDILLAVLDGRTVDEGVAFELGYARAQKKICIGLKTDDRMLLSSGDNPMITLACDAIFPSTEQLLSAIGNCWKSRSDMDFPGFRRHARA